MALRATKAPETPSEPRPSGSGPSMCLSGAVIRSSISVRSPLPLVAARLARRFAWLGLALLTFATAYSADVTIHFRATAGDTEFVCGRSYPGIGITMSTITPRDFRFYIHNVQLINEAGQPTPVDLTQGNKWQLDNVALLDFEDATGACRNGTPETHRQIEGTVPPGTYKGLRFTLGVPEEKNHTELMAMPAPLNLTAMSWTWNAGRKFARLDFSSTGAPRGYTLHLGSTGCAPDGNRTKCKEPNQFVIDIPGFDPTRDVVLADLKALLKDTNVDDAGEGCMASSDTPACRPILANFPRGFFRK